MKCTECEEFSSKTGYCKYQDTIIPNEFVEKDMSCLKYDKKNSMPRSHNVGTSDYSTHKIQPWDIWIEYRLNPFDADIVKRILRKKAEPGKTEQESRRLDYEKIIHICQERIRQIDAGIEL